MTAARALVSVLSLLAAAYLFDGCVTENATAIDGTACDAACAGGHVARRDASAEAARAGGAASGGSPADASESGGASDAGGTPASGGVPEDASAGGAAPITYSFVVDTPTDGSPVDGVVTVSGVALGYQNVEVWDSTHKMPPLAEVVPRASGAFSLTVDTSVLAPGPTTWTVWAWNSPPGQPFDQSDSVPLFLTITVGDSGSPPETIGIGNVVSPAVGPAASDGAKIGGAPFVLVKNWNFGTSGTIKDVPTLVSEFQFHDQFNTIANGTKYGAVIVAPNAATAIPANDLGLPGNMQPVEDPAHPTREWTADSIRANVRPLSASQATCSPSQHDAGNGSLVAKWKLSNGGVLLGKDVLWETRIRMPKSVAAYWLSLWASGDQWNNGAEMDLFQSFGTPNIYPPAALFHANSLGGKDDVDYASWPAALTAAGVPAADRDLSAYHVVTWVYKKDDSYTVYFDGIVVQTGSVHWTLGGAPGGQAIDLNFLFDLGWGHTTVMDMNPTLPAASFPLTYEIDYSRVYLR